MYKHIVALPQIAGPQVSKDFVAINQSHAVICISNSEDKGPAKYPDGVPVLNLVFDDIVKPLKHKGRNLILFNREHAQQILSFVEETKDVCEILICQCTAGVSRSAAVGATVSKILYDDDEWFFKNKCPNMHVYRTILHTYLYK